MIDIMSLFSSKLLFIFIHENDYEYLTLKFDLSFKFNS